MAVVHTRFTIKLADIRERVALLEESARLDLDRKMAVDYQEHFAYQQAQAAAHVSGRISTADAQMIYMALGEVGSAGNGGWASGTDTATKVVVTLAMGELLRPTS